MLSVRSLSRLSNNLLRLSSTSQLSRCSSAQASQQPKEPKSQEGTNDHKNEKQGEQGAYVHQQSANNELPPYYDEAVIDPFMKSFEFHNLSKEEREHLDAFLALPRHKKAWPYLKILTKNTFKFLANEWFDWQTVKYDQYLVSDGDIDIRWEFKEKQDIKRWMIACDSMMNQGYSTTSLTVNKQGRLVFSGYLDCDHLPNDGVTEITGFAHLSSPYAKTGYGLEGYYNWSKFNHLLLRFRGDGRVYRILLKGPNMQGTQEGNFYEYFLYTRGGPYWQVAKIPFSKFMVCYQGRIQEKFWELPSCYIQCFAFTVNKYTGPFRLELSHVGLQLDERNYQGFDYEGYFRPEFV